MEDPLFLRITPDQEFIQQQAVGKVITANKSLTFRQIDEELAEYFYRRSVRLPFPFENWTIRPFWRDCKYTPPLPMEGRSGKVYKPIQRPGGSFAYNIPKREID